MATTARTPRPAAAAAPSRWYEGGWAGVAIVLFALAIRLVHCIDAQRLPLFDRPTVDAALYVEMAKWLAADFIWPEAFYKPPLYPYVLGTVWRFADGDWFVLRLPGIVCGALTAGIAWWMGRRLFGVAVGWVAGLFWALHRPAVYFEGELLEIGLVTCLHVGAAALVLRTPNAARPQRAAVLAGLALGLATVARPTLFLFDGIALAWLGRRAALPALIGLVAAILPVTLHNVVRGRDLVLVSSNLGVNYYLGNNPRADGRIAAADRLPANPAAAETAARTQAETAAGRSLRPSQVSDYWLQQGLAWDAAHPGAALGLLVRKLFYAWNAAEIADNEDLSALGRHLHVYRLLPVGTWLLAPLGLVGLYFAPRRRDVQLLRLYVVCQIAALLPFFLVARFRLPWMPVLAVFAAWTIVEGVRRARGRAPGLGRLAAALALAALFTSIPAFGVRAPVDFDLDYKLGYAWREKGDLDRALASFRDAVRRNPRNALAQNALGVTLAAKGEHLDEAAAAVEAALGLDPARAAHYAESLAGIELQRGRPDAAIAAAQRGLAASPDASTRAALLQRMAAAEKLRGGAGAP